MKLFYFPLENLSQRMYSTVNEKMKDAFVNASIDYVEIIPQVDVSQIDTGGCVMSGVGHCRWCLEQLLTFMSFMHKGEVKDGDICYFDDLWFPGLEAIFYSTSLLKIRLGVYGFIHAGSFTPEDFVFPMRLWARDLEKSWFNACSGIFVGSQQTKDDILKCNLIDNPYKIAVTGLPFEIDEEKVSIYLNMEKENIIIFPHRDDIDKGLDDLLKMILLLRQRKTPFEVVLTCGGRSVKQSTKNLFSKFPEVLFKFNLSKDEYYQLLAKSKVLFSSAIQENFGVCVQEALAFNVIPVCPDRVSYQYLLPNKFRYRDLEEAVSKIFSVLIQLGKEQGLQQFCHHKYSGDLIVHHILLREGL